MTEFNLVQVHLDEIVDLKHLFKFVGCCMCHVPFLLTGTYFRLSFAVLSAAYLDKLGLIPILIFWIANVAIGYKLFDRSCHPLWLISFVSIYIPVCFGIRKYKHGYVQSVLPGSPPVLSIDFVLLKTTNC